MCILVINDVLVAASINWHLLQLDFTLKILNF